MNRPPNGGDPAPTEPIPVTPRPAAPPPGPARSRAAAPPRFGNVPLYLIARLLAFAIDLVVVGFVVATFVFNFFEPSGLSVFSSRDQTGFGTVAAASLGIALAAAFLCEALFGTTLGKAIFALQVRRSDGGHAGVGRIFVRTLLRPLDAMLIGPLLALATPRHQRLGDLAGGTVVARSRVAPLASLLGVALIAALVYAQYTFGGGLRSAFAVGAEAANFGPGLLAKGAALVGLAGVHPVLPTIPGVGAAAPVPMASPSEEPSEATNAPLFAPSDAPSAGPSADEDASPESEPSPDQPAPGAFSTDAPADGASADPAAGSEPTASPASGGPTTGV